MSAPAKNPFDLLLDQIRAVVREELAAALNGNGNGHGKPLTAEELAEKLQIKTTTVYQWAKAKRIPCLKVGRFLRFNLQAVLDSLGNNPVDTMRNV